MHSDTRGILHPHRLQRHVELRRYEVPDALEGLIDWCWSVRWHVPEGESFAQDVASHPGVNVSAGCGPPPGPDPPASAWPTTWTLNGVSTGVSRRVLRGDGFNLAAKSTTGGFGAWVDDVAALTDRVIDGHRSVARACGLSLDAGFPSRIDPDELATASEQLCALLVRLLERRPPDRVAEARDIAEVARHAERERDVRRVDDLARAAGVSGRTLQRRFASCAGVSPTWVIRRFRLLDAAEIAASGEPVDWADVAQQLGYADQPHLIRDFTSTLGVTPAAYARQQRADAS